MSAQCQRSDFALVAYLPTLCDAAVALLSETTVCIITLCSRQKYQCVLRQISLPMSKWGKGSTMLTVNGLMYQRDGRGIQEIYLCMYIFCFDFVFRVFLFSFLLFFRLSSVPQETAYIHKGSAHIYCVQSLIIPSSLLTKWPGGEMG